MSALRRLLNGPAWGVAAGGLAAAGGEEGRRAAIRGGACYIGTALVVNLVLRPLLKRRLPLSRGLAGCDTSFTVGASQEMRAAAAPLAVLTALAHRAELAGRDRRRRTAVLVADAVGAGVAVWSNQLWPSKHAVMTAGGITPRPGVVRHPGI